MLKKTRMNRNDRVLIKGATKTLRRENFMKRTFVILLTLMIFSIMACEPDTKQVSSTGAEQASFTRQTPKNSRGRTVEQQNIMDRLEVTTNPTKIMWIHLIALDGKILKRMVVRNKVTSSGKRLEPRHAVNAADSYPNSGILRAGSRWQWETDEFIQPDGTFGNSDAYIYWFDVIGRYHQWGTAGGLGYLLTDFPISLKNPMNEITGLYNANKAATMWQKEKEAELRKKEGGK